jgi:hypothetical protein
VREASLASIIEGISSYLAYEKLSGTESVEVESEVRRALFDEELAAVPVHESVPEIKVNKAPPIRLDGNERSPDVLFLKEGVSATGVWQEPFEGEEGALLKKMIWAMGISMESGCVAQLVVADKEVKEAVRELLKRVKPRATVVLGEKVLEALLDHSVVMRSCRGSWMEVLGVRAMPTHGLEDLLGNVEAKRETWQDLQAVMKSIG